MINHYSYQLAMRNRALLLEVATTGSTTLAATTTGYTRSAGSFIDDGFAVGLEVAGTGFSNINNNAAKTITAVTATTLSADGCGTEGSASGRTLTVGLPALRAWENVKLTPVSGRPYVIEQYIPGPMSRETLGPQAVLEARPMYNLAFYAVADSGLAAASLYADALLDLFPPGQDVSASNGDILRVRGDVGPSRSQMVFTSPNWCIIPVTIPFRVRTVNSI